MSERMMGPLGQEKLRLAAMNGEADKVLELLRRDDAAAFIDLADKVRNGSQSRGGNGWEAQGCRVAGSVAVWEVALTQCQGD